MKYDEAEIRDFIRHYPPYLRYPYFYSIFGTDWVKLEVEEYMAQLAHRLFNTPIKSKAK